MIKRYILAILLFFFISNQNTEACGPWFDDSYLAFGNEFGVFAMPNADFYHELEKLGHKKAAQDILDNLPESLRLILKDKSLESTSVADTRDIYMALREKGIPENAGSDIATQYLGLRKSVQELRKNTEEETAAHFNKIIQANKSLLDKIPTEFKEYLLGAVYYRLDDFEAAQKHWNSLLTQLPPKDRKYRTTWAAYMMGKIFLTDNFFNPDTAIHWFNQTRKHVSDGFSDTLELAGESYGQEGAVHYNSKDYLKAMHSYVRYATLSSSEYGTSSIRFVCNAVFRDKKPHDSLLRDPLSRSILTAWVAAHPNQAGFAEVWLNAADAHKNRISDYEAGRLAWIAYNLGQIKKAQSWVRNAHEDNPYARWVRVKLLLRAGNVRKALKILQALRTAFPKNESWRNTWSVPRDFNNNVCPYKHIHGELGVLLLARREYVKALDLFLQGGYWYDAAYVAEKVLTTAELEKHILSYQKRLPELMREDKSETDKKRLANLLVRELPWDISSQWHNIASRRELSEDELNELKAEVRDYRINRLIYVLARRLLREKQWDKSLKYYNKIPHKYAKEAKNNIKDYIRHVRSGKDSSLPRRKRAEHFFAAARIIGSFGIELMGTEAGPDWAVFGGTLEISGPEEYRLSGDPTVYSAVPGKYRALILAGKDEKRRAAQSNPKPNIRFHYRYHASELFWKASELLPDNDLLTAKSLYYGGKVILTKVIDPARADRFYKALVKRCSKLGIGMEADQKRWFPPEPDEWRN